MFLHIAPSKGPPTQDRPRTAVLLKRMDRFFCKIWQPDFPGTLLRRLATLRPCVAVMHCNALEWKERRRPRHLGNPSEKHHLSLSSPTVSPEEATPLRVTARNTAPAQVGPLFLLRRAAPRHPPCACGVLYSAPNKRPPTQDRPRTAVLLKRIDPFF